MLCSEFSHLQQHDTLSSHVRVYLVLSHSVMSTLDHRLQPTRLLCPWRFSRQEYQSGQPNPSPGDLPDPGIKPRCPALQEDSLPSEPPRKPKNTGVGSLSLLQGILPTQESNRGLLHCRQILYQISYQGRPKFISVGCKNGQKFPQSIPVCMPFMLWLCSLSYQEMESVSLPLKSQFGPLSCFDK